MRNAIGLAVAMVLFAAVKMSAGDVQENWTKHCASCHAKDGSGNTRMGKKLDVKDYRDSKVQDEMKDDKALKTIKEGLVEDGKERMKPYAEKLTEEEMKALIGYIRAFKKTS